MTIVTVIIPVLNDHRISRALDSVLAQRLPDDIGLQVVVVDDSGDGTSDILENYQGRIVVSSTPGGARGVYRARNHGIALAKGDFINFIGADDVYADENVIADLVGLYDRNLERGIPGFVHGWITVVDPNGPSRDPPRRDTQTLYDNGWILPDMAILWTRQVFDAYGLYSENYRIAGDHEFFRRVVLRHQTPHICLDRTVTLMECGGLSSVKTLRDEIRVAYELWLCMRSHPQVPVPAPFGGHISFPAYRIYRAIWQRIVNFIGRMPR